MRVPLRVFFATRFSSALFFAAFFLLGSTSIFAQETTQPDRQFVAPKKRTHPIQKKVEQEPPVTPDGILTKAYESKQPLQMISPFAPASYGTGEEMISENPDERGKQNGLIIFGIEW